MTVTTQAVLPPSPSPLGDLERRFYAFVLDRAVAWGLEAGAGFVAWRLLVEPGRVLLGAAATLGAGLLVWLVLGVLLGTSGTSPGNALLGLRVVRAEDGGAVGVPGAMLRSLVLGVAGWPTLGLGAASLAWTVVMDPEGRRRGWHDHLAHSIVIDVRSRPQVDAASAEPSAPMIDLTALRLTPTRCPVPASATTPAAVGLLAPPTSPTSGPPPRHAAPTVRWRLAFDSGESFEVAGPALVGRGLEPRAGGRVRHVAALRSEDLSVAQTLVRVELVPDGSLVVVDRGSTNGTVVVRRGVAGRLTPGRATRMLDGDVVRLGDRSMSVERLQH